MNGSNPLTRIFKILASWERPDITPRSVGAALKTLKPEVRPKVTGLLEQLHRNSVAAVKDASLAAKQERFPLEAFLKADFTDIQRTEAGNFSFFDIRSKVLDPVKVTLQFTSHGSRNSQDLLSITFSSLNAPNTYEMPILRRGISEQWQSAVRFFEERLRSVDVLETIDT